MSELQLGYGKGSLSFTFDERHYQILSAQSYSEQPLTDLEIGAALDSPIESPPLEEQVSIGDSVLIVVSDATRATASAQVVNLLVRRLIQSGVQQIGRAHV